MWSRCRVAAAALVAGAVVCWGAVAVGADLPTLTDEEARRPAEEWTLQQILDKGWTPYKCFFDKGGGGLRAIEGRRWPQNDSTAPALGSCVSYSFMPDGLGMEVGEGPSAWFAMMPPGSSAEFTTATGTWAGVADLHFTLVGDGGVAFNAAGLGLRGNIRVTAGTIPMAGVLAHGYYPPPNGVSAAGDVHFDWTWPWVTAGAAPGPPYDVETVSLHELGHALGLTHAGTVAADVMFPSYSGIKLAPTAGDIGFMTGIYGAAGHAAACTGACCHDWNVCSDDTEAACLALGFTWRGPGTVCPSGSSTKTANHASGPVVHWTDPALDCFSITLRSVSTNGGCIPGLAIDAWRSPANQPTCHNFGPLFEPESPAIPADFFEPGSQPFEGQVCLMGQPLGPTTFGQYGEADTLILRSQGDPFDRCELPSPLPRTVDIEIVALNLVSLEPIIVNVQGQTTLWDVQVDLSVLPAGPGQLTARKEHCNGGTYSSILPVQPRFTFTKLAGPGIPPGSQVVLDHGLAGYPPIQLQQTDNPPWSHDIDPYLTLANSGPDCTGFHPGVEDTGPQTACDCNVNGIHDQCDVESGFSLDCNANGIPDECDPDADGDGIPDDCDQCPDIPGALCTVCNCVGARSLKDHDPGVGVNELTVGVGCTGGIEPRFGGVTKLELDLDSAAAFGGGVTVACAPTAYVGLASVSGVVGNTVTITFIPGLPDETQCTVTLDCGAGVCVRNLEGDSNIDGASNPVDNNQRLLRFGQTAAAAGAVWDVNADGSVNPVDNNQTLLRFGNAAPACP